MFPFPYKMYIIISINRNMGKNLPINRTIRNLNGRLP